MALFFVTSQIDCMLLFASKINLDLLINHKRRILFFVYYCFHEFLNA